ncbi:hypothetical protein DFH07DRAFT_690808, partial [Mycena maculata]
EHSDQWSCNINAALQHDQILTDNIQFGSLALNNQLALNTWSGMLMDADSLPDNWTCTEGVLVGMR